MFDVPHMAYKHVCWWTDQNAIQSDVCYCIKAFTHKLHVVFISKVTCNWNERNIMEKESFYSSSSSSD